MGTPLPFILRARIPGARGTLLPGVAHLSSLEAPAAFNAALKAFLSRLPG